MDFLKVCSDVKMEFSNCRNMVIFVPLEYLSFELKQGYVTVFHIHYLPSTHSDFTRNAKETRSPPQ